METTRLLTCSLIFLWNKGGGGGGGEGGVMCASGLGKRKARGRKVRGWHGKVCEVNKGGGSDVICANGLGKRYVRGDHELID